VASYSTGITVTWDGTAFSEVTDLTWSYGGGLPKGRSIVWTDELGSVAVTCLSTPNVSTAQYGKRATLTIAGGGASLTTLAVYEGFSVTPELNGVTRYSVTFKILDG
jgi:hypothetical protein